MTSELAFRTVEQLELLADQELLVGELGIRASHATPPAGGTIMIHLGPSCRPEVINILRSQWPTETALNFSEGREFHMRLRRHRATGYYVVYGSVTRAKNDPRQSIFAEVLMRGRVCRTLAAAQKAVAIIRQELLPSQGILKP